MGGVAEQNLPGLSVAVGMDREVVWAEGFGFADLRSSVPVTPDHRFRIGTGSRMLTSAAAGLLIEKGRLKLTDEIQAHVPAFPPKPWPVTLRDLMAHTAGLPTDADGEQLITRHCERPEEALRYFAEKPLLFQPGTQHQPSSYGWILVSAAVEATAGKPFLAFMRDQVFDPLGMHRTIADPGPAEPDDDFPVANLIRELIFDPRAKRGGRPVSTKNSAQETVTPDFTRFASDPNFGLHLMRPLDYSCYSGAAVFATTPSDMVRFGMAMHGGKLLQPSTVQTLQTSQRLVSGAETGYGLGWQIRTVTLAGNQTRAVGHDGHSLGGMVASFLTFLEYAIIVAVISNVSFADTSSLAERIARVFADRGQSADASLFKQRF